MATEEEVAQRLPEPPGAVAAGQRAHGPREPSVDVPATRQVDDELAARVFRRAVELDREGLPRATPALDEQALVQIGAEAGISPDAIRLALREHEAGLLEPSRARRRALVGEPLVIVQRVVPGPLSRVRTAVATFCKAQLLDRRRHSDIASLWTPRDGFIAEMRRSFERGKTLKSVTALEVRLVPVPGERGDAVQICLSAELASVRRGWSVAAAGGVLGGGTATVAGVVGAVVADPFFVAAVPAGAAVAAGGYAGARSAYRRQLDAVELALEGFLDGLTKPGR